MCTQNTVEHVSIHAYMWRSSRNYSSMCSISNIKNSTIQQINGTILTASMSPASVLSSMLCKTSAKVFQVTAWLLPSALNPMFEYLHIDLFSIILVFVSYGTDPYCIVIFQQENTKLVVVDSNLLGNIDLSHSSLKFNAFTQSWSINLLIY